MKYLKYNGKRMCLQHWAREVGLQPATLAYRLKSGWSLERALTENLTPGGRQRSTKPATHPHIAAIKARVAKSHAALSEHMHRELLAFIKSFSDALVLHSEVAMMASPPRQSRRKQSLKNKGTQ